MTNYYNIENDHLLVTISTMGATLVRFIDKETGKDIVTGFDEPEGYLQYRDCYMGAMVGRYANRIGGGHFTIGEKEYDVPITLLGNCLHGGEHGLTYVEYEAFPKSDEITLKMVSGDGDEGFPGRLEFTVNYKLEDRSLICSFEGYTDKDTLFNITNHSYFNLNGAKSNVFDQYLYVPTKLMAYTDETGLTYEELNDISGSFYDFGQRRLLGECLANVDIDNNYHFGSFENKLMAVLDDGKMALEVYSDLPDMHIYPGNHFNGIKGKNGLIYNKNYGIALEAQYYPNAINYSSYPKPILKKGETETHTIIWKLRNL